MCVWLQWKDITKTKTWLHNTCPNIRHSTNSQKAQNSTNSTFFLQQHCKHSSYETTQVQNELTVVESESLYLWEISVAQHGSRSDRKKEGKKGMKGEQLYYFCALKVNSMQHAHDATAGNKRVTTSFEVFPPIKGRDRLSAAKPCTFTLFKVFLWHFWQNKDNWGTRITAYVSKNLLKS